MGSTRNPSGFMKLDNFDLVASELRAFKDAGGGALVEVTCNGWGRDLDMLARLSEAAEVHIISTSGFYIEPHIPYFVDDYSVERLADYITTEVQQGVGDSQRRCGVFKSAIHRARVEAVELKVLQAVAIAQKRTGAAITTHTTGGRRMEVPGGTVGVHQLQILKEAGVDPTRLIVGHVDERPDIDVLTNLGRRGLLHPVRRHRQGALPAGRDTRRACPRSHPTGLCRPPDDLPRQEPRLRDEVRGQHRILPHLRDLPPPPTASLASPKTRSTRLW